MLGAGEVGWGASSRKAGRAGAAALVATLVIIAAIGGAALWVWRARQRFHAPLERGQALLELRRHDEAIASFELARQSRPDAPAPLRGLAACYLRKGQLAAAAAWAEQAIARDASPDSRVLAAEIALVEAGPWASPAGRESVPAELPAELTHAERVALQKAIGHAQAAAASHPECAPAHRILAEAMARLGDVPKAVAHIRRAIELDPAARGSRLVAADILALDGRPHEALEQCRRAIAGLDPLGDLDTQSRAELLRALRRAARLCTELKLGDQAAGFWHRFLAAGGDKLTGHVGLTIAAYVKGDYAIAVEEGNRAMRLVPPDAPSWDLHYYRGLACLELGRYERAAQEMRTAITIRDRPEAQFALGRALLGAREPAAAREAFLAALRLQPGHLQARRELVKLLEAEGHVRAALEELRRGVAATSGASDAGAREPLQDLAAFCLRHGRAAEAEEALCALHQHGPPRTWPPSTSSAATPNAPSPSHSRPKHLSRPRPSARTSLPWPRRRWGDWRTLPSTSRRP